MSNIIEQISDSFADIVEATGPSIVRIEARRRLPATGIIWSADGIVVTAHHVVQRDKRINVGLSDGNIVSATLVGRDATTDIAVLQIEGNDLPTIATVDAASLRVGHLVLALGRPGMTVQATQGIVSALGQAWQTAAGGKIDRYLQTDVTMYPGFSGGPLVTAAGQVAGINTSALWRGVSLTIPVGTIRSVVDTLQTHGHMPRGYLGISIQPVRLPESVQEELNQETGLMMMSVEPDGAAATAGILQGDIIVALDGEPVRHVDDLQSLLSGERVGKTVPVQVVRGGQSQNIDVTIGQK